MGGERESCQRSEGGGRTERWGAMSDGRGFSVGRVKVAVAFLGVAQTRSHEFPQ
jgi:hypothetical protein